jgi:glycosyltransferase involved in cell wall biosynthesis
MLNDYALKSVGLHLRQCDVVVATSQQIKQELIGIERAAEPKILVKPNAINTACFPVTDRPAPAAGEMPAVVSVSRLEPKKGLLDLVEAAGRLRDRGRPIRVHIVGGADRAPSSQEYATALLRRIDDLEVGDLVRLEGRRSEQQINDFFRQSQVFVAPYVETDVGDKDGIPTAVLEAMSSGLPVVATDAGSIREAIAHGREGLIVPQRDPQQLADAIGALVDDPEALRRLGLQAARKVRDNYEASIEDGSLHARIRTVIAKGIRDQ